MLAGCVLVANSWGHVDVVVAWVFGRVAYVGFS